MKRKITKNFYWYEAASKCGRPTPLGRRKAIIATARSLERFRSKCGDRTITIVSWYRTPQHNRKVKGRPKSKHLLGIAVDLRVKGMSHAKARLIAMDMMRSGELPKGGIGFYPKRKAENGKGGKKGFLHLDFRGKNARWRG